MKRTALAVTFILILLTSLLLVASVPSLKADTEAPQVQWEKKYGEPIAGSLAMAQTADGGYIMAGGKNYTLGSQETTPTPYLVKTDQYGNTQWEKTYDNLWNGYIGHSIFQTKDSGYLIFSNYGMAKTDLEGNIQWNNTLSSTAGIYTSEDKCLLLSNSQDENGASITILLKTDIQGNVLWNQTFSEENTTGTSAGVAGRSVIETADGGYAVTGSWEVDCWFLKIDSNGNTLLNKTYRFDFGYGSYRGFSIIQTEDNGFIIAGANTGTIPFINWLAKIDDQGNVEWVRDDYLFFHSIAQTDDGYFGVGGTVAEWPGLAWVVKLDDLGSILWNETYGNTNSKSSNEAYSLVLTSDGGYAVAGRINDLIWLIKFTPESATPPDETSPFTTTWIVVAVITVAVVSVSLLFYFKKRKH